MTRGALIVLALLALPGLARAHDRSVSYLRVSVRGSTATLSLRIRALDQNALDAEGIAAAEHLSRAVVLESAAAPCAVVPGSVTTLAAPLGWARYEWRARCDGPPTTLRARPIPMRASHVVHARVEWPDAGRSSEHLLGELSEVASLEVDDAAAAPSFASWLPVGVEHILTGVDHLLFLAMLLLLGGSIRQTAAIVTGFTVGHSVTLSAAALGLVEVDVGPVEALIGLSVALVAVENVWLVREARDRATPVVACAVPLVAAALTGQPAYAGIALFAACHLALVHRSARPVAWRGGVAAVFGLFHGFGFAGALAEGGLPAGSAFGALLGFNVGVELGQLAIVLLAWPLLAWLASDERRRVPAIQLGSAVGVAAGTFWFVTRGLG
ncbi:MAG: HupE/UreJ family protein [Sandaracinaceae bacterium]|nr:HupE/UreJ family protein [Sandaracinaceae bacterium]